MSTVRMPLNSMQPHIDGAVRQGIVLDDLMARSCIDLHYGDNRDLITPAQRLLLCINTVLTVEDATHGLATTGIRTNYPALGLLMALGCATLEGAIQALSRFYASESNAVHIRLTTDEDFAVLSVSMDTKADGDVAYLEENFLIWLFIQCLRYVGHAFSVFDVSVRDPEHFNLHRPHWGIQAPVVFSDVTAFRFSRSLLAKPASTRAGSDVMWECHRLWLDYVDGRLAAASPAEFVERGSFVRFGDLARGSGVSPNTLRRHLQAANSGFRGARQRALVQAASIRLYESRDSVETIAADLGYSDAKSLRRFLKTATGLTPQQIREQPPRDKANDDDARARLKIESIGVKMNV